jgi:hypothetical protein
LSESSATAGSGGGTAAITTTDYFQNPASGTVSAYIQNSLFLRKKFLHGEGDLDFGSSLQVKVCSDLSIPPKHQQSFWLQHRQTIRPRLTTKRWNVNHSLGKEIQSKFYSTYMNEPCAFEANPSLSFVRICRTGGREQNAAAL